MSAQFPTVWFLLVIAALGVFHTNIPIAAASEYLSFEDFVALHPEQITISQKFKKVVDAGGVVIGQASQKGPVRIAFIYPGNQVSEIGRAHV